MQKRMKTPKVKDEEALSVWDRFKFPTLDIGHSMNSVGDLWFAARNTVKKPYCWTPTKPFSFGGKEFVPLYKCIAFATRNFGNVIQAGPQGLITGRE